MTYKLCKHFWVTLFLITLFRPQIAKATESPNLISPSDNSIISDKSPKLTWEYPGECPSSGSCFRIELDETSDFKDPEKSSYTNSNSYSPQKLTESSWYWRVKAKDKDNKWSDWSKVFKFSIGTESQTPPPTINQTPLPTSLNQESSKPQTSFEIKDHPSEINSNQEFELQTLLLLPKNPNQTFYLKAAFKNNGSSNYFGETFSGNEWVKNGTTYSKQFKIQTDASGKWEGKIKIKPDSEDSGFDGSGDYILKAARYSDSGSGPIWSNELNIKINYIDEPSPSPSDDIETSDEWVNEEESLTTSTPSPTRNYEIKIASVAGEATMSNNIILKEEQTRVLEERKINWLLIVLGIGVAIGGIGFTFYKIKPSLLARN